jgi:hypothetical protein
MVVSGSIVVAVLIKNEPYIISRENQKPPQKQLPRPQGGDSSAVTPGILVFGDQNSQNFPMNEGSALHFESIGVETCFARESPESPVSDLILEWPSVIFYSQR